MLKIHFQLDLPILKEVLIGEELIKSQKMDYKEQFPME